MARTSANDIVRKDAADGTDEVSPELLDALAKEVPGDDEDDDGDADDIIALDEDGDDDDEDEDGDDEDDGDNLDDAEDDDDDEDDDEDDDDSDDDEDEDDMNDLYKEAPEETEEDSAPEEDEETKGTKETKKSSDLADDLKKAIDAMAAHGRRTDPQMRKEALMAKELNGGGLSRAEKAELAKMLVGGPEVSQLQKSVLSAQSGGAEALAKSMVSNEAMGLSYDNITKSLLAQAEHLENSCQGIEQTQFLMAKALVKVGETVAALADRQGSVAKSLKVMSRQPVAAPRSVGVDWARKSLAGARVPDGSPGAESAGHSRLAKASPARIDEALNALAKSAGPQSEMGRAFSAARDAVSINRPLMPSISAKVEEYLADH